MRYLTLSSLLWLLCAACADDDANVARPKSVETSADASSKPDAVQGEKDAAAANSDSRLPRPSLPRPPGKGLPPELHPPR